MDLIWEIIYFKSIKRVTFYTYTDRFALFIWAQNAVAQGCDIIISDFTTSWKNGLAFCGLLNHFNPGCEELREPQAYKILDNLRLAFRFAEEKFEVPKLLEPSDVSEDPDEISLIIYVSLLFWKLETSV